MMVKYKNVIVVALTVLFVLAGALLLIKRDGGMEFEKLAEPVSVTESTDRELFVGESININTTSKAELERVPNIGPSLASAIIEYRDRHGAFSSLDELVNVKGIGETTLDNIRGYLRTEG